MELKDLLIKSDELPVQRHKLTGRFKVPIHPSLWTPPKDYRHPHIIEEILEEALELYREELQSADFDIYVQELGSKNEKRELEPYLTRTPRLEVSGPYGYIEGGLVLRMDSYFTKKPEGIYVPSSWESKLSRDEFKVPRRKLNEFMYQGGHFRFYAPLGGLNYPAALFLRNAAIVYLNRLMEALHKR